MFAQLLNTTLRILLFRAGPQDLPFEPRLTWPLAGLAAFANFAVFVQVMPLPSALAMSAAMVGGMALVARALLRARDLLNRYHQTFAALMLTTALLTLLLAPLFAQIAPVLRQIAADPQLLEKPEALQLPGGTAFLMNLLNIWNFAVTASIFRQAANVNLWIGLLVTLLSAFMVLMLVAFAGSLAAALFGVGA